LQGHINSLSRKDRLSIRSKKSMNKFRFGDGVSYPSQCHLIIPIYVGDCRYELGVDVVTCDIPLLLSHGTWKRAKAKIDIDSATIQFLGSTISLITSSSGHLCLPISRSLDISNVETQKVLDRVMFASPLNGVSPDLKSKAKKLHVQFCHPSADRLINLLTNAGTTDERVFDAIKEVTLQCDVCLRNKKAPLRPVVGFPIASSFNETVALDLKARGQDGYILHMIDHLTRYSSACLITNKRKRFDAELFELPSQQLLVFSCH